MEDSDSIQQLQERMDILEMRLKALSLKEVKPTKSDLRAIKEAEKDRAAGRTISLEELKKKYSW